MADYFYSRKYLMSPRSDENEVAAVADKLGWGLIGEFSEDVSRLASREFVWGEGEELMLHYREDVITKSPCAFITGSDERRVDRVAHFLETQIRPASLEDLLDAAEAVQNLPEDYSLAVLRLGLGAPAYFDERFAARIQDAAWSSNVEVRKAAAWATSYVEWVQFVPMLTKMAEEDPSEEVRRVAMRILGAYKAEGGTGE
ncbi:hypothetical protein ACG5V6_09455 [Streptomyces chitinivorans]|uniref:HEAT repeat domain-containing protein n=1 Tax=Streptomyces chitinivorans TaxID=1257027 RepID=A0ABW7HSN8_9ACTN|nr:hypothetical protein [Streptomyces chitinivorans]MDH2408576.1 hypothetical protein [Streptomyces chitinivorans]